MNERWRLSPSFVVIVANVILALVAFVREAALGAFLGTTYSADAFALSLYISDVQANTILYSSILFAAVPVFSSYVARGNNDSLERTMNSVTGAALISTLVLCVVNAIAAPRLIGLLGMGLSATARRLAIDMLVMLLPLIPCYVLFGLFSAGLQAMSEFSAPAFGPVVLNLVFLAGLAFTLGRFGPAALAIFYSLGAACMFALQAMVLRLRGVRVRVTIDPRDPGLREILTLVAPIALIQILTQPGYLVERLLAGRFGEGGISSLAYAFKVSQIPVWVFVAALGAVAFPALSRSASVRDSRALSGVLEKSAVLTMAVTLPSALVLGVFARQIVALLFMRGAFGQSSLDLTSLVLRGFSATPVTNGFVYLLLRACYAVRDTRTAAVSTLAGSAVTVIADVILASRLGLVALGVGSAIGSACCAAVMAWRLRAQMAPGLWPRLTKSAVRLLGCGLVMIASMLVVEGCWPGRVETMAVTGRLVRLASSLSVGFLAYAGACLWLGFGHLLPFRGRTVSRE